MGGNSPEKSRKEMTREEREEAQRLQKRQIYLRRTGRPSIVTPAEFERAVQKVQSYRLRGMSFKEMSQASGGRLTHHVFAHLCGGRQKGLRRTTWTEIMKIEFSASGEYGPYLPKQGSQRRVQALRFEGWPLNFLAAEAGLYPQNIRLNVNIRGVYRSTIRTIENLYEKFRDADPTDHGIDPRQISRCKTYARRMGFVPSWCWDSDTIDDPDAIPEWTGACGTEEGYAIHVREWLIGNRYMPICEACRKAVDTGPSPHDFVFDREAFVRIAEEKQLSYRQICVDMWGTHTRLASIYQWASGKRAPMRLSSVRKLAGALEVPVEALLDMEAGAQKTINRRANQFNGTLLQALLDQAGLSYRQASLLPGSTVTSESIGKWCRGIVSPMKPDKVRFLADHFGFDVKEFYGI